MKGRKIDLATANDALILDTFDLMATYGCARDTIRVRMRKGIIPPPLDRVGGRFRWTAGYLREWDLLRAKRAIEAGSVRISVSGEVIPGAAQRGCPLYLRCSMPDLMR